MRMRVLHSVLLAACIAAPVCGARAAESAVAISFHEPGHFTDAALYGGSGDKARAVVLNALRERLNALGGRYFGPGQTLKLDILDVDLAGRYEWWIQPNGLRVLDDVSWPSIKLSYVLEENGAVLRKGEETVSDLDYLTRFETATSDPLWREKAMLSDWFRRRFAAQSARN
jgi:hypothetical protein